MKKVFFFVFLAFVLISACSSKRETSTSTLDTLGVDSDFIKTEVVAEQTSSAVEPVKIKKDTVLDNAARFIAGLPQLNKNSFTELEKDKYWIDYKASMDANWKKMYDTRLGKIADWEKSTFSKSVDGSLPLFYPFSGPDFLHAFYLFPHAHQYMLAALEPIRAVVPLDASTEKFRDAFLDSLGHSLRDIFNKSYFITNHMEKDLKQVKGVLPALYFFIERTNHEMLAQKFITVDSLGNEMEIYGKKINWQKTPGVKITFRDRTTNEVKTLYYFSVSISNGGLKDRPNFVRFIASKAPFNSFVKSASYLMHKDAFTKIKDLLIANSNHVFQDDTGMPYKYLKNKLNWKGQFYGEYVKPVRDFSSELYQKDIDSAYQASKPQPLPFSLGYHWSTKKQNYMLFSKEKRLTINK
jgi:hypothetical protein